MRKKEITISPSLLAADFLHLERSIREAQAAGADSFHADVMDGVYVPNISFGFDIIGDICGISHIPVDAHLMIKKPYDYIAVLSEAGVRSVTVHSDFDDEKTVMDTLYRIKKYDMKAGISLRPRFAGEEFEKYRDIADLFLIMTVEPGFGGQKFMYDMVDKISTAANIAWSADHVISVQVDGGINRDTIAAASRAGADDFVIGTSLFRSPDIRQYTKMFRDVAEASRP